MVTWGTDQDGPALLGSSLDLAQFSTQTGQLSYASGATADGFMLAGAANDANTADTYELGLDGSLSAYGKRASEQTLLAPAATAYDGWFYVLAASENEPYDDALRPKALMTWMPLTYSTSVEFIFCSLEM